MNGHRILMTAGAAILMLTLLFPWLFLSTIGFKVEASGRFCLLYLSTLFGIFEEPSTAIWPVGGLVAVVTGVVMHIVADRRRTN